MEQQIKDNLKFLIKEYGSLKTAYQMMLDARRVEKLHEIDNEIEKVKKEIDEIIDSL